MAEPTPAVAASYEERPATAFDKVADGVYTALRREFGSAAGAEELQRDARMSIFGFQVDGVSYSLSVNVTE